jgi:hypothetical protein
MPAYYDAADQMSLDSRARHDATKAISCTCPSIPAAQPEDIHVADGVVVPRRR